jgi:small subunit ribosomal protein S17
MPKRILTGTVTSDKNEQTVTVLVERRFTHPVLKKTVRQSKKYRAHDADNRFKTGDIVRIQECAPVSKTKRWEVLVDAVEASPQA